MERGGGESGKGGREWKGGGGRRKTGLSIGYF